MGLFGLLTTQEYQDMEDRKDQDMEDRKEWKRERCSKGEHFVGYMDGVCDICKKKAKLKRDKKGNVIGWKW